MRKIFKRIFLGIGSVLAFLLVVVIVYVAYVIISYHRVEDNIELSIVNGTTEQAILDKEYKMITFNIGFGAYEPDFGFFMDGGKESRAFSKERLIANIEAIEQFLNNLNADYLFLQEIDEKATRTYKFNERESLTNSLLGYDSCYGQNWDSAYLFYPIFKPHGKTKAGLMTFSKTDLLQATRYSLPIEKGLSKFVDLDRCYTKSVTKVKNGKELILYNAHLSAYTKTAEIAEDQIKLIVNDMQNEINKGNYVICGGDFNKNLLGEISTEFSKNKESYNWAKPFPVKLLEGTNLLLKAPYDINNPVPSCRNADGPYNESQFVVTVDGFIVSDNVNVKSVNVIDTKFKYSDHNPVELIFTLK